MRHHRLSTFAIVSNFLSELLPAGMDNPSHKATGRGGYGQQSLNLQVLHLQGHNRTRLQIISQSVP